MPISGSTLITPRAGFFLPVSGREGSVVAECIYCGKSGTTSKPTRQGSACMDCWIALERERKRIRRECRERRSRP